MIQKILQQLRQYTRTTYNSPLNAERQAECLTLQTPAQHILLNVPNGENAVTYQSSIGARLYTYGSYTLTSQTILMHEPLVLMFFREHGICKGNWSFDYLDHEKKRISLSGCYQLKIDHIQRLAQTCINNYPFYDDSDFAHWIVGSIAHILTSQRIPTQDIHAENERFTHFLRDALPLALRPKGLLLEDLSLIARPVQIQSTQPTPVAETTEIRPVAEHIVITHSTQPAKYYYYVKHGKQLGPFSQEELQHKVNDKQLKKNDLIWRKGMSSWLKAGELKELNWTESTS